VGFHQSSNVIQKNSSTFKGAFYAANNITSLDQFRLEEIHLDEPNPETGDYIAFGRILHLTNKMIKVKNPDSPEKEVEIPVYEHFHNVENSTQIEIMSRISIFYEITDAAKMQCLVRFHFVQVKNLTETYKLASVHAYLPYEKRFNEMVEAVGNGNAVAVDELTIQINAGPVPSIDALKTTITGLFDDRNPGLWLTKDKNVTTGFGYKIAVSGNRTSFLGYELQQMIKDVTNYPIISI